MMDVRGGGGPTGGGQSSGNGGGQSSGNFATLPGRSKTSGNAPIDLGPPMARAGKRHGAAAMDDQTVTPAGQPKPKSFTWQSDTDTFMDPTTGALTTKETNNEVLHDGTKIVRKVTTLKRDHVHGATTVSSTATQRFETVTTEERVVVEEMTFLDCFLCCCPCFRVCFQKKGGKGGEGEGDDERTHWRPVEEDND